MARLKWCRTSKWKCKENFEFEFDFVLVQVLFCPKWYQDKAMQPLLSAMLRHRKSEKKREMERQANGLRIAKKTPAFTCQWQFLSHFRSCFNWIVIEFYFTTAIFHTHSVLVLLLPQLALCCWHSSSCCFTLSSNNHKIKMNRISFMFFQIGIDFIVLHFHSFMNRQSIVFKKKVSKDLGLSNQSMDENVQP